MTTPNLVKADVLRSLEAYDNVAFRITLRPDQEGGWLLHTLVIDAIPQTYTNDETLLQERYNLQKFTHVYPTAILIADVTESSEVISWFDTSREIKISAKNGPGTSTRVVTTRMPKLQDASNTQTYFYRTAQSDGFDRMRWPHTIYTFYRTSHVPEQYDETRLVASARNGSRSFANFKMALTELIYGVKDWEEAQRHFADPTIAIRVVTEKPFFADIRQEDQRHMAVRVNGRSMLNTAIQLEATGGIFVEREIRRSTTYHLEVPQDIPQKGRLTLVHQDEVLDEYEWDSRYAPLPGALASAPIKPAFRSHLGDVEHPVEINSLMNRDERVSAQVSEQYDDDDPPAIRESLAKFRKDHPNPQKTGFIMMRFGSTPVHDSITQAIKETLVSHGLEAVRADDKQYHDDLYPNILTYLHGCGFGIAVYERIESEEFNPNVALEVGYMLALRRPVCHLKDKTLKTLPADLVGKLYRQFDLQDIEQSIPKELENWLRDQDLL